MRLDISILELIWFLNSITAPPVIFQHLTSPNMALEWLPLLLYILEVSGSNLSPETGHPY
jgi:hypothetical protein